jgi:hypothetical protein
MTVDDGSKTWIEQAGTWTIHEPSHSLPATPLTRKITDRRRRDVSFVMMLWCCCVGMGNWDEMNDRSQSWIHVEDPPDVATRDSTVRSFALVPHRTTRPLVTLENDLILP